MQPFFFKNKIMPRPLRKTLNITIPANTTANTAVLGEFVHPSEKGYKAVGMGVVEVKNTNNIHYNLGLEVVKGSPTLDNASKNFYLATKECPINQRLLPISFEIPSEEKSWVRLVPTEPSGAADIIVQILFLYEG